MLKKYCRSLLLAGFGLTLLVFQQGCSVIEQSGSSKAKSNAQDQGNQDTTLTSKEQQVFQSVYFEGLKNKHIGNTVRAVAQFRKALGINPYAPAAHYELSRILEKQKANDSALFHARKAVTLSDSGYWYMKHLAKFYRSHNRYEEAAKTMEAIIDQHKEGPQFYYQLANTYIRQEKLNKALETYERFEDNFGVDPQVVRQQKRIYLQLNKVEKAADAVRDLIESNPQNLSYHRQLAKIYMANNQLEKAKRVYEEMLKIDPNDGLTHLALAQYHNKQGQQDKAFNRLKKAFADNNLAIDKKVKFMLSNYLQRRLDGSQQKQAAELAAIITESHPKSAKAHATEGDLLYRQDRLQEAMKAYEKALKFKKDNFSVWQNLLQIYLRKNRYTKLERESARAMTYFPNQPILYYFHGLGLKENGKLQKAVQQFKSGVGMLTGNQQLKTQFYSNLGMTYHDLSKYEQSDKFFQKALKLNPSDVYVLNNYSWYLALRGDSLKKAEEMSAKTLEKRPKNSAYLDTYGWIQYKKGNYEKAKKYIGKAIEQSPKDPELLEHYGDVFYKLNKPDKALQFWKDARRNGGKSESLEMKISTKKLPK